MTETLAVVMAGFGGAAIGVFFFGGLWWTVAKGLVAPYPALWFLGSFVLRTALTLLGFYFMFGGDWRRLAACLVGFLLARFLVTQLTHPPPERVQS